ncbi:uncharacterized protein LOC121990589 [Zingiber officinale]|uniref:Uncharacterized protein n=1 Tax=Zingiber officinale TaxID=94328 RepID=A0A8J5FZ11_ZINOF|nr:uncharacterized protein LOC121990589 [Zingiber officinale]KAG6497778.1 hypothetical protein ZIOFF_045684 [Zingiber officinale]
MERLLECHGKDDSLRNTMLRHEEIFRQQVHELHRLYRVQKMLMTELGKTRLGHTRTRNFSSAASTLETSHSSSHVINANLLSICPGDQLNVARGKGFNLGRPAEEFTSKGEKGARQKINEMWPDDESEVELTLSVGCGGHHTKEQANSSSSSSSSSSGLDRKRLKSPPWLMQGLNLNTT